MLLALLGGCAMWVGEPELAAFPISNDDLARASVEAGPALPAGFAAPSVRSVAPDPMLLGVSSDGFPTDVRVGGFRLPEAFTRALGGAAGGGEGGTRVEVLVERFQLVCLAADRAGVSDGAHVVAEGSVRFGEGAWERVAITRHADTCDDTASIYAEAGVDFAGEIGRLARRAKVPTTAPRPLPTLSGAPVLCVAQDARPYAERVERRASESLGLLILGAQLTTGQGNRTRGRFWAGDGPDTIESRALTDALARSLKKVFPGLTVGEDLCTLLPPERVSVPTVWARLDHAWVAQYLRSTAWSVDVMDVFFGGFVSIVVGDHDQAATQAFAYWRAGLALCVEDVCRGTTLAGTNRGREAIAPDTGYPAWETLSREALGDLGTRARDAVAGWAGRGEPEAPYGLAVPVGGPRK